MTDTPTLRPYQRAAVEAVRDRFHAGDRATLVVLPTGTGKTVVFTECARMTVERGGRALVVAHREELLDQACAKLHAAGVDAAIEQGKRRAGNAPVVVASVQTLRDKRLQSFAPDAFRLLIPDEAHHAVARTWRAILDHFEVARVLGVTATPDRGDGAALGQVFTSVAYEYELRAAIRDGYLVPIRAKRIDVDGVDLSAVHTRAGDLAQDELAAIMGEERALHGVAVPLLEQAGARKTVLFAVDVAHAIALAEVVNRYRAGCARVVHGEMDSERRGATIAAFERGEFQVLCNVQLLTEGWDCPSVECVAIARPTKSRALYTQEIGRGTRPSPATGKRDLLVLDFAGNSGRHALVGPADVLAGRQLPEELRLAVERALTEGDEQLELEGLLDQVEGGLELQRAERKATAVARYLAEEFDPFIGPPDPPAGRESMEPATSAQRAALATLGLAKLPPELTVGEAIRLTASLQRRREMGLCSLAQARLLAKFGYSTVNLSFADANKAIGALRARGFKPFGYAQGARP